MKCFSLVCHKTKISKKYLFLPKKRLYMALFFNSTVFPFKMFWRKSRLEFCCWVVQFVLLLQNLYQAYGGNQGHQDKTIHILVILLKESILLRKLSCRLDHCTFSYGSVVISTSVIILQVQGQWCLSYSCDIGDTCHTAVKACKSQATDIIKSVPQTVKSLI